MHRDTISLGPAVVVRIGLSSNKVVQKVAAFWSFFECFSPLCIFYLYNCAEAFYPSYILQHLFFLLMMEFSLLQWLHSSLLLLL